MSLTPEREAELREFWPTDQPIRILAERWGLSVGYVSLQAKEVGLPSRQNKSYERHIHSMERFTARIEAREYFEAEARRRSLHPLELSSLIIQIVSNDRMINAILDDEESLKQKEVEANDRT